MSRWRRGRSSGEGVHEVGEVCEGDGEQTAEAGGSEGSSTVQGCREAGTSGGEGSTPAQGVGTVPAGPRSLKCGAHNLKSVGLRRNLDLLFLIKKFF